MRYVHSMVRISNLDESLDFYCNKLGLVEVNRHDSEAGRYTNIFLAAEGDVERAKAKWSPMVELTYNWESEDYGGARNFGHLAYYVDDIYAVCQRLMDHGVTINRPPRGGWPSSARPTTSPSSCCRRATPCRSASPGNRCRTPANGDAGADLRMNGLPCP